MTQIAINMKDNVINDVVLKGNISKYKLKKGWLLVESNPAFSIDEIFKWTVRQSDNKLVRISTGMTPDEEKTQADALLGKNVGEALAKAQTADTKAENAVASAAQLGKLIAPLLATQASSNTDDGGTK